MPYIPFTEEQKLRANNVNLVEFLRRQGEKLIPSGRDKRLSSDYSITVRGNEWYDHESKEGGHAISFVQTYYGLTYPEAVKRLLDGEGVAYPQTVPSEPEKPKEFVLPPASPTMRRLYAYLLQQRFIDRDVLDAFTKRGMIYESCEKSRAGTKEYHNAVFVGSDEYGAARHAHKRSLYTQGNSFRRNVEGGDPRCSFHWFGNSGRLYVFEAPIDLLAFLTSGGLAGTQLCSPLRHFGAGHALDAGERSQDPESRALPGSRCRGDRGHGPSHGYPAGARTHAGLCTAAGI